MNWFQRHLNWIVVLFSIVANLVWVNTKDPLSFWFIGFLVATPFVCGWALKQKGRSLWHLLILFLPFGWIWFLCLENRRQQLVTGHVEMPFRESTSSALPEAEAWIKKLPEAETYIGNRKTHTFHRLNCRLVQRMSPNNAIGFVSAEQALTLGYDPCVICNPSYPEDLPWFLNEMWDEAGEETRRKIRTEIKKERRAA